MEVAGTGQEALDKLSAAAYDLVITDLALGSGPGGMEVLQAAKAARSLTPVVLITAHGSEKVAVSAMKAGAEDYVAKPFDNDEIRVVVRRALERTKLEREHRLLLERVERELGQGSIIGSGPGMQQGVRRHRQGGRHRPDGARSRRERHRQGTRRAGAAPAQRAQATPFVAVNCAAIPRAGRERAVRPREGRVHRRQCAAHRTLRGGARRHALPGRGRRHAARDAGQSAARAGGATSSSASAATSTVEVDVRVIAATHRDLEGEVAARHASATTCTIGCEWSRSLVPPLRERREDMPRWSSASCCALAGRLGREQEARRQRRAGCARAPRLARQRARAAQRGRASGRAGGGRDDRARRPARPRCDADGPRYRPRCRRRLSRRRDVRRRQTQGHGRLRARLLARCVARTRRQCLARGGGNRHGACRACSRRSASWGCAKKSGADESALPRALAGCALMRRFGAAHTRCGAVEQEGPLAGVARERRRALELRARLVEAPELGEQVAAHAGQQVVARERRLSRPARRRAPAPPRARTPSQTATARLSSTTGEGVTCGERCVERGDARPVGVLGRARPRVAGGDRGLQRVRTARAAAACSARSSAARPRRMRSWSQRARF